MSERFERHRQPWKQEEIAKLHNLAKKGQSLKSIARALTRSEESMRDRAKADGLTISKAAMSLLRHAGLDPASTSLAKARRREGGTPDLVWGDGAGSITPMMRILVDADACPVKDEIYKVAFRREVPVAIVSNQRIRVPDHPLIERVVVVRRVRRGRRLDRRAGRAGHAW